MSWKNNRILNENISMKVDKTLQHHMFRIPVHCVLILFIILMYTPIISSSDTSVAEMKQGMEYVRLKMYPKAVASFQFRLSKRPNDIDALFALANVYRLQDALELAIETSEKILSITSKKKSPINDHKTGLTHLLLSEVYSKQSKLDVAEGHAKLAVERCSPVADTYYRLGFIYTHQAKFEDALIAFKRTLELNPDFAEVYQWLGLIALMQKKPQEAITHYKTAIQKKPFIQSAYYNLAKAYRLMGDMESAAFQLRLFQKMKAYYDQTYAIEGFLSEDPANAALRMQLAKIHVEHSNMSAAIATYQAVIRLDPEYVAGYDQLGRLYMEIDLHRRAIPLFHKVLELNADAVEAHVRLGWLYSRQDSDEKAIFHLQKAIEKMPAHSLAYHGLAEIYAHQGRIDKAIEVYRHITKIAPTDRDAWTEMRRLEDKQRAARRK